MIDIKIKPNEIAFDCDDVLVDFIPLFLQILKEDSGLVMSTEQVTIFNLHKLIDLPKKQVSKILNKAINSPFRMQLKIGAKDIINKLSKKGPVLFVTARKNGKLIKNFIEKELQYSVDLLAMNSRSKVDALKKREIKYFIDDNLETCYEMQEAGITPILFDHPHNASGTFMRVHNWAEIDKLIDWEK